MATAYYRLHAGQTSPEALKSPALVMVMAVCVLALPSAVLAYSSKLEAALPGLGISQNALKESGGGFAPGETDPHLTRALAARSRDPALFRYTPAGLYSRPDRSVTVAVRVDEATAHSIVVRGPAIRSTAFAAPAPPVLHLATTAYNLGLAHGYQGFTPASANFTLPKDLPKDIARDRGAARCPTCRPMPRRTIRRPPPSRVWPRMCSLTTISAPGGRPHAGNAGRAERGCRRQLSRHPQLRRDGGRALFAGPRPDQVHVARRQVRQSGCLRRDTVPVLKHTGSEHALFCCNCEGLYFAPQCQIVATSFFSFPNANRLLIHRPTELGSWLWRRSAARPPILFSGPVRRSRFTHWRDYDSNRHRHRRHARHR
jgi:hypothetical protein